MLLLTGLLLPLLLHELHVEHIVLLSPLILSLNRLPFLKNISHDSVHHHVGVEDSEEEFPESVKIRRHTAFGSTLATKEAAMHSQGNQGYGLGLNLAIN